MTPSVLDLKTNGASGERGQYQRMAVYHSADAFMLFVRTEWWEGWGRAIDISERSTYPEFFTVDVVFRSSAGRVTKRFLIPTKGPDA